MDLELNKPETNRKRFDVLTVGTCFTINGGGTFFMKVNAAVYNGVSVNAVKIASSWCNIFGGFHCFDPSDEVITPKNCTLKVDM